VKTTLNKLAVKPDCSWHVFNEFDLRSCSEATGEVREARTARSPRGFAIEGHMIAVVWWFR
jgi:hypothetical protein